MFTLLALLAGGNPLGLLLLAIQLFLTTAFFPFQVARPLRGVPVYTYALIGINTFIFLITVLVANINLPQDRVDGQKAIAAILLKSEGPTDPSNQPGAVSPAPGSPTPTATAPGASPAPSSLSFEAPTAIDRWLRTHRLAAGFSARYSAGAQMSGGNSSDNAANNAANDADDSEAKAESAKKLGDALAEAARTARQKEALELSFKNAHDADGWKTVWQIDHAYSTYVLEPHYTVQNVFGYSAARPTLWGLIGSMFLHMGFMHLAGNMLYLWVFGRALEETLGPLIFLGSYLVCGVAAVFLYHIITTVFTPQSAGVPLIGASGAIAGVLGLFALRFYRTPVKIFYIQPFSLLIVFVLAVIGGLIGGFVLNMFGGPLAVLGFCAGFLAVWIGFLIYMRKTAFGTFQLASAWSIGIWLLAFNALPGVLTLLSPQKQGGVAHWAHIGGFAFGMLYAALIGSKQEGSLEYALEDAQKAYEGGNMESAVERAENVLLREPDNGGAFEVIAKAHDSRGGADAALDNYEIAIQKYLQAGERDAAAALYLHSLIKNPGFILEPRLQFAIANQMARNADFKEAADNLAKIPFTFPEAPEGELSLLRAAQVYVEQLNELDMATYLLNTLLERYPETQWMAQVQRILKVADYKSRVEAEENAPVEVAAAAPSPVSTSNRAQAQLPPATPPAR